LLLATHGVPMQSFTTVTRGQGNNLALKSGVVRPAGFSLQFVDVPVLVDAFRRMVRASEFDICEMAMTTYLCARAHGKKFTAIPVFLVRGFHHGTIMVRRDSGLIANDIEGTKVGVNRGYTVTTGVWARAILQEEYGVDLSKVTWVPSGDEHVVEYRPPANVVPAEKGAKLQDMLLAGELSAIVGIEIDHPDLAPLIPDPQEAGLAAYRRRGHYPINHTIVIRDELVEAFPDLAPTMFDAFARSKQLYVEQLKAGKIEPMTEADETHRRVMAVDGKDPLPYGIVPNIAVIDQLIGHAVAQRIIDKPVSAASLFVPATRGLAG
jgi:4,5-dihydroxyphthalate decarboxylase